MFFIEYPQAVAKGAPPETPIIENFFIFSLSAISNTMLGQSRILKFGIESDSPYPGLSIAMILHFFLLIPYCHIHVEP